MSTNLCNHYLIPTGWRCPVCGRVYSPAVLMCLYCPENDAVTADLIPPLTPKLDIQRILELDVERILELAMQEQY